MSLLILNDDPFISRRIAWRLECLNFESTSANRVDLALRKLQADKNINVILIDLSMSGRDASKLMRIVQRSPLWSERVLEFIATTGDKDNLKELSMLDNGTYQYLEDPTEITQLCFAVENAFKRAKYRQLEKIDIPVRKQPECSPKALPLALASL